MLPPAPRGSSFFLTPCSSLSVGTLVKTLFPGDLVKSQGYFTALMDLTLAVAQLSSPEFGFGS